MDSNSKSKWPAVPSWLLSAVAHVVLVIVLGILFRAAPAGALTERERDVQIVLKQTDERGDSVFADAQTSAAAMEKPAPVIFSAGSLQRPLPVNLIGALPAAVEDRASDLPTAIAGAGLLPAAGSLTQGVGRTAVPDDPLPIVADPARPLGKVRVRQGAAAETEMFGVKAKGHLFVYVIDRSNSMGQGMRYILEAAKKQAIASVNRLEENHQFQIICYNDRPTVFRPGGVDKAPFADARNKQAAREFITQITPTGGTQHDFALFAALGLQPDAIFFLTDAHPPGLSRLDLDQIKKSHTGAIAIHTIEFGLGAPAPDDNFLRQLSRENGGGYRYIDVTAPVE